MDYSSKNIEDKTEVLDGNSYTDCMFRRCILEFQGGKLPKFFECTFIETQWAMRGPAANTIEFLKRSWETGDVPTQGAGEEHDPLHYWEGILVVAQTLFQAAASYLYRLPSA